MARDKFLAEVATAFQTWSNVSDIIFSPVASMNDSLLNVTFSSDIHDDTNVFSDGTGGKLAQAHKQGIHFDAAERWLLQGETSRKEKAEWFNSYAFLPVAVHEVGHILGLRHAADEASVMYPYYREGVSTPSEQDVAALTISLPAHARAGASGALRDVAVHAAKPEPEPELEPALEPDAGTVVPSSGDEVEKSRGADAGSAAAGGAGITLRPESYLSRLLRLAKEKNPDWVGSVASGGEK